MPFRDWHCPPNKRYCLVIHAAGFLICFGSPRTSRDISPNRLYNCLVRGFDPAAPHSFAFDLARSLDCAEGDRVIPLHRRRNRSSLVDLVGALI